MDSSITGRYLPSVRVVVADTAIPLPDAVLMDSDGVYYTAVLITVETNDIRIRWTSDPTQGASPEGHLVKKGDLLRVIGKDNLTNFRVIASVALSAAVIQVTPEY